MQKGEDDLITLQIKCSGRIKGLTVTADGKARVKAMWKTDGHAARRIKPGNWMWARFGHGRLKRH